VSFRCGLVRTVAVAAGLVILAGCSVQRGGPGPVAPATACGPVTVVGTGLIGTGFRADVPAGWSTMANHLHCGTVIKKEPVEAVNPITTISLEDGPGVSLVPYTNILRSKLLDKRTTPVGGVTGGTLTGEQTRQFDFTTSDGNRNHVLVAFHGGRAYFIEQVAPVNSFADMQSVFDRFLRSWRWV
jgi:hypothetical protein